MDEQSSSKAHPKRPSRHDMELSHSRVASVCNMSNINKHYLHLYPLLNNQVLSIAKLHLRSVKGFCETNIKFIKLFMELGLLAATSGTATNVDQRSDSPSTNHFKTWTSRR